MNAQIIALVNQKGGTTKTTSTVNLGVGLAQAGKKVLVVDGDPQASLSISLGHHQPDKLPATLADMMGKILTDQPITPGEGILHHPEGIDLMPSNIELAGMEVSLVNAMSRETILRQYLDTVKRQYTHILIDCQPSLGMLTVNALAAANRLVIPCSAEYLPAKGLEQLLSTVNKVRRQINPKPGTSAPCCGRPTAAKSRCLPARFPTPSGQRRSVRRARASSPTTPAARWRRRIKI